MSPYLPFVISWQLLLASMPSEATTSLEPGLRANERHIQLTADTSGQDWEVRISPRQASNLMFNAPLRNGSVLLQERELFHSVMVDEHAGLITLLPSAHIPSGKTLMLAVAFADQGIPESTTFRLVVHSGQVEQQVRVERKPRSVASFQQEARQQRARAEHCEASLGQENARPCQEGLVGMFDAGLVKKGIGIRSLDFFANISQSSANPLVVKEAYSYRAIGRVAVELWLDESQQPDWRVGAAEVLTEEGHALKVLRTWQPTGVSVPKHLRQVVVEAEAPEPTHARGPLLLRLMEAEGPRTVTVRGVLLP